MSYVPQIFIKNPEAKIKPSFTHVLGDFLLSTNDVFFIQIGAFDGIHDDPLFKLVRRFGWPGILVEPQVALG